MKKRDAQKHAKHREAVLQKAGPGLVSAVDKLIGQMESESEAVSQRAAKEIIDLFSDAVMKEEEREIVVRVVGMPDIGMPDAPGEAVS